MALLHGLGFILPHRTRQGVNLTIDIRHVDGVPVHQAEKPDPGTCQSFRGKRTHAADAEDGHPRRFEPRHLLRTQEHFGTGKPLVHPRRLLSPHASAFCRSAS